MGAKALFVFRLKLMDAKFRVSRHTRGELVRFRYASLNARVLAAGRIAAEKAPAENLHRGVRNNYLHQTKFASSSSLRACPPLSLSFSCVYERFLSCYINYN